MDTQKKAVFIVNRTVYVVTYVHVYWLVMTTEYITEL